tara:strand:- start:45 stop:197 length:153 start_codon:yes stop_codon:yes gene_type:complete
MTKKKKTLSQKVVGNLKKELRKRKIGKTIGLTRNQQTQNAIDKAFGEAFK